MKWAAWPQADGWRAWTAAWLLPVVLLVALVPRGYMPDGEALWRGRLTLALCVTSVGQQDGGDAAGRIADRPAPPCPFALLPGLSLPPLLSLPFLPLVWRDAVPVLPTAPVMLATAGVAGLGARGPPVGR